MGYFVFQTYSGLAKEETSRLRFFGETIFDEIEDELIRIVHNEEARFVDEYNPTYLPPGAEQNNQDPIPSPLSKEPSQDYILGYFQNNPDGSFHSPLEEQGQAVPDNLIPIIEELQAINIAFNKRRAETKETPTRLVEKKAEKKAAPAPTSFEEAYLDRSQKKAIAASPRQKENRVEEITVGQAQRLSRQSIAGSQADEMASFEERDRDGSAHPRTGNSGH